MITGMLSICYRPAHGSALLEPGPPGFAGPSGCRELIVGILERTNLNIVFSAEPGNGGDACIAAIRELLSSECRQLPAEFRARLQIVAPAMFQPMLPSIDWLIAADPRAIIWSCWAGLKPVQIGPSLLGSDAFTHRFADVAAFLERLASDGLSGQLTIDEYTRFDIFCQALSGAGSSNDSGKFDEILAAVRTASLHRDPLLQLLLAELRLQRPASISPLRKLAGIIANPFAAARLYLTDLADRKPVSPPRPGAGLMGPDAAAGGAMQPRVPAA
jgi:hypothetical protein